MVYVIQIRHWCHSEGDNIYLVVIVFLSADMCLQQSYICEVSLHNANHLDPHLTISSMDAAQTYCGSGTFGLAEFILVCSIA